MLANVLSKIMEHADIRTTPEVYCDVFANYEKQHSNTTYKYLKQNNILLVKENKNDIPVDELTKIMENIKTMYQKQDIRLIKLLKMMS